MNKSMRSKFQNPEFKVNFQKQNIELSLKETVDVNQRVFISVRT